MIVGETTDGKTVVSGVFKMYDTLGLPLADIFEQLSLRNMLPSFPHFYDEATAAGWKHKTIILRLREALGDVYGSSFAEEVTRNKSLTLTLSEKIPKEMLHHFIRGYFDGDGSISITTCPTINFTSGSESMINSLRYLFKDLGVVLKSGNDVCPIYKKTEGTNFISYSGKNAEKILYWMYNDSTSDIRMDRKYNRHLHYFNMEKDDE